MKLGTAIRNLRKAKGMKQAEFASRVGLSQSYLSQVEGNKKEPSVEVLKKVSDLAGVPLPVLLWDSLTGEDVPKEKKEAFEMLKPAVDALIKNMYVS